MTYTNSPLISYTRLSPNRNHPRNHEVDRITPHCVVGQLTTQKICALEKFITYDEKNGSSCNLCIGTDGGIGLIVPEEDRSWCSDSRENDHRAITIECASDKTAPYAFNDVVYAKLIDLCADICRRHGKNHLLWIPDKKTALAYTLKADEMLLTAHRWFAATACPGDWMYSRMGDLAAQVNRRLGGAEELKKPAGYTSIAGQAVATAEQMQAYIMGVNPTVAQSVLNMIPLYLSEGATEGIRGDVAFAQSCLETGNFTFVDTAVTLDQNNFCGMGVLQKGMKGNAFASPQLGVRAQIQHLKAYATSDPLNCPLIDPRYKYVEKGCSKYVEWLGQKENPNGKGWAAGAGYGEKILTILNKIIETPAATKPGEDHPATGVIYKVQTGAYSKKENADAMAAQLKAAGFDTYITTEQRR